MSSIQKVSSYMFVVFAVLIAALPVIEILKWIFIDVDFVKNFPWPNFMPTVITPEGPVNLANVPWSFRSKMIGFLSSLISLVPLYISLFSLRSIFRNYKVGDIFTSVNARHYRLMGGLFFLNALLIKPLSEMLMILSVTLHNPPGHRYISLGFGTPNLESMFYGAIIIVISWIMLEAAKLREDQDFTI